jgi:hypothetical protein
VHPAEHTDVPFFEHVLFALSGTGLTINGPLSYSECMPLYFFNFVRDSVPEARPFKNEGLELVDNYAAWEEATLACGEKLREMDGSLRPGDGWTMEVTDASGKAVFVLKFTTESLEQTSARTEAGSSARTIPKA